MGNRRIIAGAASLAALVAVGLSACSGLSSHTEQYPLTLQDSMDAKVPAGAQNVSYGGTIEPGERSMPMGTGTGLPAGTIHLTLACKGVDTVTMTFQFPEQKTSVYTVACGTPLRTTVTTSSPGMIGFGASTPYWKHPHAEYYAGLVERGPAAA